MLKINSYKTSDSSKKITTYIVGGSSRLYSLDFGSNSIPLEVVKKLDYIFITHEHSDHFMGLYNKDYVDILLENHCKIYASNVTKDLIIAIFENAIRVDMEEKEIRKIRELLNKITGMLFFEKQLLSGDEYFKLFPSGHTFGSSMVYLSANDAKIMYTGDMDYSSDDSDRQYNIELKNGEDVDYIIADGTYLDSETFKDETFNKIRDSVINKGYSSFLCKAEKSVFFSKKLILSPKLKDKYCIVFPSELKWYLSILKKYNYEPFIRDKIVLESSVYELPENKKPLYVSTRKKNEKQTSVNGVVGLHISFLDFAYFLQQFDPSKTKVLIGHYNHEKKKDIENVFKCSDLTSCFDVFVLKEGEAEL